MAKSEQIRRFRRRATEEKGRKSQIAAIATERPRPKKGHEGVTFFPELPALRLLYLRLLPRLPENIL